MKVQIDENKYLTGSYCLVGNIENSIEMDSLPNDNAVYFPAWKILSKQVDKKVIVNEPVEKERIVQQPVLDEEGNETGETIDVVEKYTVIEPVEKIIPETVYYYELDTEKKNAIQEELDKPVEPVTPPLTPDEIQKKFKQNGADIEFIAFMAGIDL